MKKLKQIAMIVMILGGTWGGMGTPAGATELCGVGLGGICPRIARGCLHQTGDQRRRCEAEVKSCERCTTAMANCRQKVGKVYGFTCKKCLRAFNACRP